jgi:endonuclease/exonuclease/phosphatase family metal-dependent hydrolase
MLSHHMRSADLMTRFGWKRSYPGVAPLLHLDHIYYDGAMHLTGVRLHRTAISLMASDHLPLIGDFEVTH